MTAATFAAIGALSGGLVTAVSALALSYYQRTATQRDAHLLRAFEKHFSEYESIFVTCRSALDALNNFVLVQSKAMTEDDTFLFQQLDILKDSSYKYCIAVDWKHNPAMAYLELALEEKCLLLRDLLLEWLSVPRITTGDIISIRINGAVTRVSTQDHRLLAGKYEELIVERRKLVRPDKDDRKRISEIRTASESVIKELRAVMAY